MASFFNILKIGKFSPRAGYWCNWNTSFAGHLCCLHFCFSYMFSCPSSCLVISCRMPRSCILLKLLVVMQWTEQPGVLQVLPSKKMHLHSGRLGLHWEWKTSTDLKTSIVIILVIPSCKPSLPVSSCLKLCSTSSNKCSWPCTSSDLKVSCSWGCIYGHDVVLSPVAF